MYWYNHFKVTKIIRKFEEEFGMNIVVAFVLGTLAGATGGVFTLALVSAAGDANHFDDEEMRGLVDEGENEGRND